MYEILISLCLLGDPGVCRQQLVAGLETATEHQCDALRQSLDPEDMAATDAGYRVSGLACQRSPAGLSLQEIADGIYVHTGDVSEPNPGNRGDIANLGFVVGDRSIAVIDAGGSRAVGEAFYRAIRSVSSLPISHLILTHVHPDHLFGASVFADAGVKVVGHPNLERALRDREEAYLLTFETEVGRGAFLGTGTDFSVTTQDQIDLGGRILELRHWPVAHSTSDLTVWDGLTGTLFAGDLVFDRHVPVLDGSLSGWLQVLAEVEDMKPERIVPGHGAPVMRPDAAIEPVRTYLELLETDTRRSLDAGRRMSDAVPHIGMQQSSEWELFDVYNARNATVAYTELEWE
ncbi:quinoprotein relay system zinc metallohydrolase 2 [Roseibium sp. MMSF_3412]|uniref:quinoprotein relay system zinc metallohydrolase 2 n=1 Tax=Roseibium sp. MMSF_3412 TaxID=3046712 RepID=UPI00273E0E27|nr:quinoprotein relay system zinc metallohydrolase 2 [Roseibium sp. MMSF_3412]